MARINKPDMIWFGVSMSVMGYLICRTCKQRFCLGKWLREKEADGQFVGFGFWRADHLYEQVGLKAPNFLAQHTNHNVLILSEGEMDKLTFTDSVYKYEDVSDKLRTDWPSQVK